MLEVRETPDKGRGVFARRAFVPDEVLERAPAIVLPDPQWKAVERTVLKDYYFVWEGAVALALGYGSLYNHSLCPNAEFEVCPAEHVIIFRTLRHIAPGEEITINYNQGRDEGAPLWFQPV